MALKGRAVSFNLEYSKTSETHLYAVVEARVSERHYLTHGGILTAAYYHRFA